MSRDRALAVAASQDGLITRRQARAAGLSPDAIRHAIRAASGRRRPSPGVIPVVPSARAVVDTVTRTALLPPAWRPTCARRDGCPDCWDGPGHRLLALRNVRALMCEVVQRRRTSLQSLRAEVAAAPHRGLHPDACWRVLPVSPARLRAEPAAVLREIEAAYLSGGSLAP